MTDFETLAVRAKGNHWASEGLVFSAFATLHSQLELSPTQQDPPEPRLTVVPHLISKSKADHVSWKYPLLFATALTLAPNS